MFLKQLSIFIENRVGALTDATGILTRKGIDIKAFSIADTRDFGIMRMIVSDCDAAADVLREAGYVVNITPVMAVETDNLPGAFHTVLTRLSDAGVFVEYSYAFVSPNAGKAQFILKVSDDTAAEKALF
jgi:ACT domain-containing protein